MWHYHQSEIPDLRNGIALRKNITFDTRHKCECVSSVTSARFARTVSVCVCVCVALPSNLRKGVGGKPSSLRLFRA